MPAPFGGASPKRGCHLRRHWAENARYEAVNYFNGAERATVACSGGRPLNDVDHLEDRVDPGAGDVVGHRGQPGTLHLDQLGRLA